MTDAFIENLDFYIKCLFIASLFFVIPFVSFTVVFINEIMKRSDLIYDDEIVQKSKKDLTKQVQKLEGFVNKLTLIILSRLLRDNKKSSGDELLKNLEKSKRKKIENINKIIEMMDSNNALKMELKSIKEENNLLNINMKTKEKKNQKLKQKIIELQKQINQSPEEEVGIIDKHFIGKENLKSEINSN